MFSYIVEIKTPNQMFLYRGKPTRSPVVFKNVTQSELLILKTQALKNNSIIVYYVQPQEDKPEQHRVIELYDEKNAVIEEIKESVENKKELSILDRLLLGEKVD